MTNSNENTELYTVIVSSEVQQFFEEASGALQKKLDRCFEMLRINPRSHPNIKSLKGHLAGYYRYRVGDYRVVYSIDDEQRQVIVAIIAHRGAVY